MEALWSPFVEFAFMRRALAACLALSLGAAPVGVLLVLRRMSLLGDVMAHALLPGAAVGFALAGFSVVAMGIGGFIAALTVAVVAGWVSRVTAQREDASFAAFYLLALALGVLIISKAGTPVDVVHVLFGSILGVDDQALWLVSGVSTVTVMLLAVGYRHVIMESMDPGFFRSVGGSGTAVHLLFLTFVVLNLVAGFQALGTLMAVGLMMLPAITARFWVREVHMLMALSVVLAMCASVGGLLMSFYMDWPSGPSIVLLAGCAYLSSMLIGRRASLLASWRARRAHLAG